MRFKSPVPVRAMEPGEKIRSPAPPDRTPDSDAALRSAPATRSIDEDGLLLSSTYVVTRLPDTMLECSTNPSVRVPETVRLPVARKATSPGARLTPNRQEVRSSPGRVRSPSYEISTRGATVTLLRDASPSRFDTP